MFEQGVIIGAQVYFTVLVAMAAWFALRHIANLVMEKLSYCAVALSSVVSWLKRPA